MRTINIVLLFVFVQTFTFAQDQKETSTTPNEQSYDLEACINYALANYNDVKNANLDMEASEQKVKETTGLGLPQIDGKIQPVRNFDIQQQYTPGDAFNPMGDPNSVEALGFGVKYTNDINLQVSQLVFDASYVIGLKAAKTYRELATRSATQTKIDVVSNVTKAFYTVLLNKEAIQIFESQKTVLEQLLKETSIMYENGFREKIDVQRVKVDLNNVKIDLNSFNNQLDISYKLLKFQMGFPIGDDITIDGKIAIEFDKANANIDWTYVNFESRIEYQLLQTQKALNELDESKDKAAYYPKLYAFGNMGYNTGTLQSREILKGSNYNGYSMVGLTLNVPIFSGLQRMYKLNQTKIKLEKTENDILQMENSINIDFETNKIQLKNHLENIDFQKENMELAKEVDRVTKIKYDQGLVTNFETVNTQNSMRVAENSYYRAVYNALITYVDFKLANGTLYQE